MRQFQCLDAVAVPCRGRWFSAIGCRLLCAAALALTACGGGGTSGGGPGKTYLSVDASDADGDALHYQWRVTAGSIDNRDSKEAVWTMPDGPGLHFAYVIVSDGHGGYAEQQYAVATDALGTTAAQPVARAFTPRESTAFAAGTARVTVTDDRVPAFHVPGSAGLTGQRTLYLPDVRVRALATDGSELVASTDLFGQVALPDLPNARLECTLPQGPGVRPCGVLPADLPGAPVAGQLLAVEAVNSPARNLRLFGHVALADGTLCGMQNTFAGIESTATVQLLARGSAPIGNAVRVNAYGDYALDAAVAVGADLDLRVRCEGSDTTLPVPRGPAGYLSSAPQELSYVVPNARPLIRKVVANGPDGNVRGQMVQLQPPGSPSDDRPGNNRFLTYKGRDTSLSACMYYRSIGAVVDCAADGQPTGAITFDDWKRARKLAPYNAANTEVRATFINRVDLNLVRRMVATKVDANDISFYVCNHPGPLTDNQAEVDQVVDTALADQRQVACVAMENTVSRGANGDQPFTKFLTFGPDGRLLTSINLDGRGEKYMPGACVACHGGRQYAGHFGERGEPSPMLGASFLPFDLGNYRFSGSPQLTEAAQSDALRALNGLVRETFGGLTSATTNLIDGWYPSASGPMHKDYVPPTWPVNADDRAFYLGVIARSCRTCHVAMKASADWDTFRPSVGTSHVCGGGADLEANGSMANSLVTLNYLLGRADSDPQLTRLMSTYLGCVRAGEDPVYGRR